MMCTIIGVVFDDVHYDPGRVFVDGRRSDSAGFGAVRPVSRRAPGLRVFGDACARTESGFQTSTP